MNLFATHYSPKVAAHNLCDKHLYSQAKEGTQMAVAALLIRGFDPESMPIAQSTGRPHKGGYRFHPATQWCSLSKKNWLWNWHHTKEIVAEIDRRFGKSHHSDIQLDVLIHLFIESGVDWPLEGLTPFARGLNQSKGENTDLLEWDCPVEAYREFYNRDKAGFAKWTGRNPPEWWRGMSATA